MLSSIRLRAAVDEVKAFCAGLTPEELIISEMVDFDFGKCVEW
jgi:hypothetical protein